MVELKQKLNIGSGIAPVAGYLNVDWVEDDRVDFQHDLSFFPWPWDDNSIAEVRTFHYLEHVNDLRKTMEEIHRICVWDGLVDIMVPFAGTVWDVANPEHKQHFNHLSWNYFCVDFETSDLGLFQGFKKESEEFIPDGEWTLPGPIGTLYGVNMHTRLRVVK